MKFFKKRKFLRLLAATSFKWHIHHYDELMIHDLIRTEENLCPLQAVYGNMSEDNLGLGLTVDVICAADGRRGRLRNQILEACGLPKD